MRLIPLYILLLFGFVSIAQINDSEDRYYFHTTINNPESLVITKNEDNTFTVVNPEDLKETSVYSTYKVFEFEPAFPGTRLDKLKNVYRIATNHVELLGGLLFNFPEKYTDIDQFYPGEAPFYPNDFGTTSPVENLGAKHPLFDLDLINAAGAWGITRGSKKVVVGISDAKIDSTDIDMKGRINNYLKYFPHTKGIHCSHGTNVAGIAIGRNNNGYGRPGICSNCSVIAGGYGSFKNVEELVAAGARVINTSWARCNMGAYHEQIEDRINELYEDGIMIVAGAGNAKNCNRDDNYAPDDYAYPASYEKVISVTGVYARFDKPEDNIYIGKEGRPTTGSLKDRHSGEYGVFKDGKIFPKYNKWDMQFNASIDICAPAKSYLSGNAACGFETVYGGATSSTAPYITGVIGLMWSVNYCLDAYETESILKLTAAPIEHLLGNEMYQGKLGAGRVDAYKAVKMARDMKELMGHVDISGRDFYRFHFRLINAPYTITLKNQTFRDSSSVDFKARNSIIIMPGTRLAPDKNGFIKLGIDPETSTAECFPKPLKQYPTVFDENAKKSGIQRKKKTFTVANDLQNKEIVISLAEKGKDSLNGRTYWVKLLSPAKQVLKQKGFKYPNEGSIGVDFGNFGFINVEITFNGKKEFYRIKKSL